LSKLNCWEFKNCGRELNGSKVDELGVCPAYEEKKLDGVHSGMNAGRCCWVVAGTMCRGKVEGTFAQKEKNCLHCDFYNLVYEEESDNFLYMPKLYGKLKRFNIINSV
jgi:hypothetical protein